jgi:hypothetical protein
MMSMRGLALVAEGYRGYNDAMSDRPKPDNCSRAYSEGYEHGLAVRRDARQRLQQNGKRG